MNPHRTTTLAAILACTSLALPLHVRPSSDGAPTTHLSAACELALSPYVGPLRTVVVTSGTYTAPFLFDTGGGGTVLSLAAAKALELTPFGRATGFRHDGSRVDGPRGGHRGSRWERPTTGSPGRKARS